MEDHSNCVRIDNLNGLQVPHIDLNPSTRVVFELEFIIEFHGVSIKSFSIVEMYSLAELQL